MLVSIPVSYTHLYFLVPYLEKFHKEFPGAHIKVTNATSIRCVELLESGQVDLIVVNYSNPYLGNITGVRKIRQLRDCLLYTSRCV